jgi:hypothetical protein
MSVSIFANVLRTQSRLRVLTATHAALPATRSISSLVAFRTAVPKNVLLSASRSFTTSQVARNEDASRAAQTETPSDTISVENNESEDVVPRAAPSDTIIAANNESEDAASGAAPTDAPSDTIIAANNESEDAASGAAPTDAPSDTISTANNFTSEPLSKTIMVGNISWNAMEEDVVVVFAKFGVITDIRIRAFFFPGRFFSTVFS